MAEHFAGPLPSSPVALVSQARGWARGLGATGVYADDVGLYTGDFECTDGGGLDVAVTAGEGLNDGIYHHDPALAVTLAAADPVDDRIDLVVRRLDPDANAGDGDITVVAITGTPGAGVAPDPTQEADGIWDDPICEAEVPAGSAVLGAITDRRTRVSPGGSATSAVAYAQVTANQLGIGTTATDLAGLSVSPTLEAGKTYKVVVNAYFRKRTATGFTDVSIFDVTAGAQVQARALTLPTDGYGSLQVEAVVSPGAGARTYKARATAENNTTDLQAGATFPVFIQVLEV